MSIQTMSLTQDIYNYLLKASLREHKVLTRLRHKTAELAQYQMQISPEQGQFMALLVEMLGAKKTLDIGTFTGYSALVVALALPKEGKVIACDNHIEWTDIAKSFWLEANVAHKIDLHLAPALSTLKALLDDGQAGSFDFVFIDADKNNYLHYYQAALALLRQGGLIVIDNVFLRGEVANIYNQNTMINTMRAFNHYLLNDERVGISMLPIGDGLTLARKK